MAEMVSEKLNERSIYRVNAGRIMWEMRKNKKNRVEKSADNFITIFNRNFFILFRLTVFCFSSVSILRLLLQLAPLQLHRFLFPLKLILLG